MARHVPAKFVDKLHLVQRAVALARGEDARFFSFSGEVAPGVQLVLAEAGGQPVVFTQWTQAPDLVELCGDAAYPAGAALLAIDKEQVQLLSRSHVFVDLAQFVRSDAYPGVYYVVLDYVSGDQIDRVLRRLVPSLHDVVRAA
jgi:hypothetical protein